MKKIIIKNFNKKETEIKVSLLNEIKETFKSYKKDEVMVYWLEDEEIEDYNKIEELTHEVYPQLMDKYCQIDATALPHSICYKDEKLALTLTGESLDPEYHYITLEEPNWGISVNGLYNLLLLLQHPTIKKRNDEIDEEIATHNHFKELFTKYSDMKVTCSVKKGAETTLKEFFTSITDNEENDVIEEFSGWVEECDDEEQMVYEAFVSALQHNMWFEHNGMDDNSKIVITNINNRILFDDKLENLNIY